jgi:DNA-binding transcriptional MerR regulator
VVRKGGAGALREYLRDAVDVLERKIQILERRDYFGSISGVRRAIDALLPSVRAASDEVLRGVYIARISEKTGVPVATIKFYLRERLLPPGTPTGRNQAVYGEKHLRRLRFIRALTNVGQLDLSTVRELLAGIENERLPIRGLYDLVNRASAPEESMPGDDDGIRQAHADVTGFVGGLGWQVSQNAAARVQLAQVLAALQRLGCDCDVDFFTPYAEAVERLAILELDQLPADGGVSERAGAVVRSVLLEVALTAMYRMAQEHHVALRFGAAAARPRAG